MLQGFRKGKKGFIGCDKWHRNKEFDHRYLVIEDNVDETELREMLENGGNMQSQVTLHKDCSLVLHPNSHKKVCCRLSFTFFIMVH